MARLHACRIGRLDPSAVAWLLVIALAGMVIGGCASRDRLNPAFRLNDDELTNAIKKGKRLIPTGDPEQAFSRQVIDVNTQISSDVILRKAGPCWPENEIAYQIALGGDSSDAAVKQATNTGLKFIEREIRFVAVLQMASERDPTGIQFALRTSQGTEYPPISVETPQFIRNVSPTFDRTAKPAKLYSYTVFFPVAGGPGIPPIGPTVNSLDFVVKVGDSEGSARFFIPRDREPR